MLRDKIWMFFVLAIVSLIVCCVLYQRQLRMILEHPDPECQRPRVSTDAITPLPQPRRHRILCWILTQPKHYATKARAVNATWAPRCDGYFFLSSPSTLPTSGLPIVAIKQKESWSRLWEKTQAAFVYIYQNHLKDYDFFMKADDDTYVIVENLRHFLRNLDPSEAVYAGRRFKHFTRNGWMSGGGGYVLSRAAVAALVLKAFRRKNTFCAKKDGEGEDVNLGKCLENVCVDILDSLDEKGRERFHSLNASSHLDNTNWPKNFFMRTYNYHPIKAGLDCCSSSAISFHYVKPAEIYAMHYYLYQLRAYGVAPDSARKGDNGSPLFSKVPVAKSLNRNQKISVW